MAIDLKHRLYEIISKHNKKPTIALVVATDIHALPSVSLARKQNIANAMLIGDKNQIKEMLFSLEDDIGNYEIIDERDIVSCAKHAIEAIDEKRADVLMKGLIDSSVLLKIMLTHGAGTCKKSLISHLSLVSVPNMNKLLFITDAGVNILPSLDCKKGIIQNAVSCARKLDFDNPYVACLCAKEKAYEKMPATTDAIALKKMSEVNEIKNCVISGPLAFDNIISKEAADIKGIDDPVAGNADIILVPNIETGNALLKSMIYVSNAQMAGIIVGTDVPIVFSSRADDHETKMNSIYMALAASIRL